MIDFYYEIDPGTTVLGKECKYLAQYSYHPDTASFFEKHVHDEALKHSRRVWLENANGVSLIKNKVTNDPYVDTKELVWIKLQAKDIETI